MLNLVVPVPVAARSKAYVCGRSPAEIVGSNPTRGMDVCRSECCVLSGRGLCDKLITRPEESYRLWCVVVCDLKTSRMRRPWPALGRSATKKMVVHIVTTGHKWLSTDEAKWNCGSIWARTIGNSKTLIYIFWKDNFENHLPTLNSTLNLPALYFHNSMWYYGTFAWKIWGS